MFTELIKEVLVSFPATQDVNLSQISIKKRKEKKKNEKNSKFLRKNLNIIWKRKLIFTEHFSSSPPLPQLLRLAATTS